MGWIFVSSPNFCTEALTPSVAVLGDGACKDAVKIKWSYKNEALVWRIGIFRRGRGIRTLSPRGEHRGKAMSCHSEKEAGCKPGREPPPEHHATDTLILDFQLPELWEEVSVV